MIFSEGLEAALSVLGLHSTSTLVSKVVELQSTCGDLNNLLDSVILSFNNYNDSKFSRFNSQYCYLKLNSMFQLHAEVLFS